MHVKLGLAQFLRKMEEAITHWSRKERREPFLDTKLHSLAEYTAAWQWKSQNVPRTRVGTRTAREAYLIPAKGDIQDFQENCRRYLDKTRRGFDSWTDYLFYRQCVWMVGRKNNGWFCTCRVGIKCGHCKHTLGMAIVKGHVDCPEEAKTVPIGRKRTRGRPSRISGPLVREDGQ